jgi:hypothetical protein
MAKVCWSPQSMSTMAENEPYRSGELRFVELPSPNRPEFWPHVQPESSSWTAPRVVLSADVSVGVMAPDTV